MESKRFFNTNEVHQLKSPKAHYESPKLTQYGTLSKLTQATTGTDLETYPPYDITGAGGF